MTVDISPDTLSMKFGVCKKFGKNLLTESSVDLIPTKMGVLLIRQISGAYSEVMICST